MPTDVQLRWIVFEGLVPLFGAGVLYWLWGCMKYVTAASAQPFQFAWREAVDSLGWLSGILIIAIQAAIKSWRIVDGEAISYGCIGGASIVLLLLLSAMNERGQNPAWHPPRSTKVCSFLLVVALLAVACRAQVDAAKPGGGTQAVVDNGAGSAAITGEEK